MPLRAGGWKAGRDNALSRSARAVEESAADHMRRPWARRSTAAPRTARRRSREGVVLPTHTLPLSALARAMWSTTAIGRRSLLCRRHADRPRRHRGAHCVVRV